MFGAISTLAIAAIAEELELELKPGIELELERESEETLGKDELETDWLEKDELEKFDRLDRLDKLEGGFAIVDDALLPIELRLEALLTWLSLVADLLELLARELKTASSEFWLTATEDEPVLVAPPPPPQALKARTAISIEVAVFKRGHSSAEKLRNTRSL